MFKLYRSVLAAGVVALGLAACGDNVTVTNPPPVTAVVHSVTVVPASATVNVGQAGVTFVASVNADSGKATTVNWSSTNTTVAQVSAAGVITALAPGQATIVATSTADPSKTGAGSLNVVALPPNIVAFSVSPQNGAIAVGGTLQGNSTVTLTPGAPAATVTWASSNANIATVGGATGTISGVSAGAAIITATATSGTQTATATIGVTVGSGPTGVVSFSVAPSAMTLFATQSQVATATVTVAPTFTAPTVVWTSLAPTVATVVGSGTGGVTGTITAVAQGSAIVTATIGTAPNTLTQSVLVTVGASASISIASITAGATAGTVSGCAGTVNAPVILTNVNCQIDVNLNLNPGTQRLDSITVRFQRGTFPSGAAKLKTVASANYNGTIPSGGPVTLSVNTANFIKNPNAVTIDQCPKVTPNNPAVACPISYKAGTVAVDLYNGPSTLVTQLWITNSGAGGAASDCQVGATSTSTCGTQALVFNNADGWAADVNKCSATITPLAVCPLAVPAVAANGTNASTGGFATDVGGAGVNTGKTYWGGPGTTGQITAALYPVVYNDNPANPPGSAVNRCNNQIGDGYGCIANVNWSIGSTIATCSPLNQADTSSATPTAFLSNFGTSGTNMTTLSAGYCAGHENLLSHRDNVIVLPGTRDAQNNTYPNGPLIPNVVVFSSTPDSFRIDWAAPSTVVAPVIAGAEGQNWVNKNWVFDPGPTRVFDAGVGPAEGTWRAFCSNAGAVCAQGTSATFAVPIVTGGDAVLSETNTKTVDAYDALGAATDLLGNFATSGVVGNFGVDRTSPLARISTSGSPSFEGVGIYTCLTACTTTPLDSTVYNAIEAVYNAGGNITTAGARQHFLSIAYGTGDSLRIDATDSRSGLRRALGSIRLFAQNGGTGANTLVTSYNTTSFLPATVDGWLPVPALHVLAGAVGTGLQTVSGYYTTTEYVVDNAGNVSGCPFTGAVSGSVCTASVANTTANTNPAMGVVALQNANLFARRTLAFDQTQPQVTGVSPNNNYTGNSSQTWTLGTQDDLEVIDTRFRIQYPNLTTGTNAEVVPATGGLVWSYALSNSFMAAGFSAGPASATFVPAAAGANFGFFSPLGIRFDGAVNALPGNGLGIVNPLLKPVTLDQFTLNVQEVCTNAAASTEPTPLPGGGLSSAMAVSTACNAGMAVGDPIPFTGVGSTALAKPTNVAAQTRDVFGSWVFNDNAGSATTGVSAEFVSPILSSTVAAPGGYGVTYYNAGVTTSCPMGGAVQPANTVSCVSTGINFRADLFYTPGSATAKKVFRSVETLSNTLPIFTRVELYGRNALNQWVFIQRIVVPATVATGAGCPATAAGLTSGTVLGCDNGNERYWFYTFDATGTAFTAYRAIGVNAAGFGLASTIE